MLLAISAGLCITRTELGPHRGPALAIPIVFFATSLVVDYVLFSTSGLAAFEYSLAASARLPPPGSPEYDPTLDPAAPEYDPELDDLTPGLGLAFAFCTLAKVRVGSLCFGFRGRAGRWLVFACLCNRVARIRYHHATLLLTPTHPHCPKP